MLIFVRLGLPPCTAITLKVNTTDTINDVLKKLHTQLKDYDDVTTVGKLTFKGKKLANSKQLKHYGIRHRQTLILSHKFDADGFHIEGQQDDSACHDDDGDDTSSFDGILGHDKVLESTDDLSLIHI